MNKINKNIKNYVSRWRSFLLDLLFPIECLNCSRENVWLCDKCFKLIDIVSYYRCPKCKTDTDWGEYCEKCSPRFHVNGVWPAADYSDQLLKKLIKCFKYRFIKDISGTLSQILLIHWLNILSRARLSPASTPLALTDRENTILIPVPLHKRRERWRGFNQSHEIAVKFTKRFALNTDFEHLVRTRNTKPQAKKSLAKRKTDLKGSFHWSGPQLSNKNIILLDDVITTGSTLDECAHVLKQAGAHEVWGLTVASG